MKSEKETSTLQDSRERPRSLPLGRSLRRPAMAAAVALASVVVTGIAFPATASTQDTSDEAANAVMAAENTIASDAAVMEIAEDKAGYESSANGVEVVLPVDPSAGITLDHDGTLIEVTVPAADVAGPLTETDSGLMAYDNRDGSHTVPIAGNDGSLQINTVISSAEAPQTYEYAIKFPGDITVESKGGTLLFFDSEEALVLFIANPWATDAAGQKVPTYFEFEGDVLTQIVEHDAGYTYPIVADPWLGIQLFQSWDTGWWSGDITYSAWVTPAAVALVGGLGYPAWRAVMATAGWDEWKAQWSTVTNKATLWQQFDCHAAAGIYGLPFTQAYNLERARWNRTNGDWLPGLAYHHCNWNSAGGV